MATKKAIPSRGKTTKNAKPMKKGKTVRAQANATAAPAADSPETWYVQQLDNYAKTVQELSPKIIDAFDQMAKFWKGYSDAFFEVQKSFASSTNVDPKVLDQLKTLSSSTLDNAAKFQKITANALTTSSLALTKAAKDMVKK